MKPLALLPLALVPAAFVIGGLFGPQAQVSPSGASEALSPAVAIPVQRFDELASNMERVLTRVDSLEAEIVALRSARRRTIEPEAEPTQLVAAAPVQAPSREAILTVLAEEDDRKAQERRERAEQRLLDQTLERAHKLAEFAGVDAGGEKILADLLVAQRTRYQDLRTSLAEVPRADRKQALRAGVEELAAWRAEQLNTYFDANVAEALLRPLAKAGDGGVKEKPKAREAQTPRRRSERKRDK